MRTTFGAHSPCGPLCRLSGADLDWLTSATSAICPRSFNPGDIFPPGVLPGPAPWLAALLGDVSRPPSSAHHPPSSRGLVHPPPLRFPSAPTAPPFLYIPTTSNGSSTSSVIFFFHASARTFVAANLPFDLDDSQHSAWGGSLKGKNRPAVWAGWQWKVCCHDARHCTRAPPARDRPRGGLGVDNCGGKND